MRIRKIIPENLALLDSLRGLTACYVLVTHALLFLGGNEPSVYLQTLRVLFRFAHEAVLFFFVLSGFVIHWSTDTRFAREGTFSALAYIRRRVRRIYPPLVIALGFTFLLDQWGMYLKFPIYTAQTPYPALNELTNPDYRLSTLAGNLLFVQNVYTPIWGTNGPLWSLMYEWWFYLLYIPVYGLFRKNKLLTSSFVLLLWVLNREFPFKPALLTIVLDYFITWYLGVLLADCLRSKDLNPAAGILYLGMLLILSLTRYISSIGSDVAVAVGITLMLYLLLTSRQWVGLVKLRKLGAFSYTLYLIHVPILCFLSGLMLAQGVPVVICLLLGLGISLGLGWLFHFVTEKPFAPPKTRASVSSKA
ncbi:hypothetical protein BWI93_25640 [Siphonobacter sp. BAB-5385]|uniref:acyltransferase family protein n=1 Tax=Siphonobacter sp. BAB-5385 TaxID=1864822 RepID=UPI000B9E1369|nr:acyltransferase [Siphonobacter sp. BAB-5385]OZI05392.1 hypothetical protein BWI93_25640 [Siphonobacter sp. BAB-5385]